MSREIDIQREQVFDRDFKVCLRSACTVGNGVIRLSVSEEAKTIELFEAMEEVPSFFIPASGSGSRMFQALFTKNDGTVLSDETFNVLKGLPLAEGFLEVSNDKDRLVAQLLEELACKPKGLIPFHKSGDKIYSAFQEHVVQVSRLFPNGVKLHFTIQEDFKEEIERNVKELAEQLGVDVSFSYQSHTSNAYCFDEDQQLIQEGEQVLRRPAGHGALLENLNRIPEDLVCLKNIDNVQHIDHSEPSLRIWKSAIGLLKQFEAGLADLLEEYSDDAMRLFNEKYQFLSEEELANCSKDKLIGYASRPSRVCGMVKNEGEPGGGPFWIEDHGTVTKQIIEKVQIADSQKTIVDQSSHFNPVFLVVSKRDSFGNSLDLNDFRDDSKYFVVRKPHKGREILYRELPGLWNGSMSNWNTLFLEIPSEVFSPVKSVMDLSKLAHQPQ